MRRSFSERERYHGDYERVDKTLTRKNPFRQMTKTREDFSLHVCIRLASDNYKGRKTFSVVAINVSMTTNDILICI